MNSCLLQASNVHKSVQTHRGQLNILNGIDLQVSQGEAVAIVGASGSGKTTLLGLLAGLDLPDLGSIRFKSHELIEMNEDQRARLRASETAFVFQSFHLLDDLTALENVALPLEMFARSKPTETARLWLNRLGMSDREKHLPSQLSGGEQQRVALCRAFASAPTLLFADEPTANLDQKTANEVIEHLFKERSNTKTSMVLVTHDPVLAKRCDRVLQLDQGSLI